MPLSPERLRDIAVELASRPQHEKVRTLVYELLVGGLDAKSTEVRFEGRVPEVQGRIDALLGRTVFEFKTDLRREMVDAQEQLSRYLADREAATNQRFVGVATDGATFIPFELRRGSLRELPRFSNNPERPRELLAWLGAVVVVSTGLQPTPEVVQRELGKNSLAWYVAQAELESIWEEVSASPDVLLKRDLWARLLARVYGSPVGGDALFFQHTYLVIIAKTMATHVLGADFTEAGDLLSGKAFREAGISGAVESDFFDWLLASPRGTELVKRIALQSGRFRLRDVQSDVLKGLYESLIDPEQRHELGEYYTPDWLAQRICRQAIQLPLEQRVLDPACGSGTFLFHAVRGFLAAADGAGVAVPEAIGKVCGQVFGLDIHPVAVQIARVTYILALGEERLRQRPAQVSIPVYLGDSLQWNTRGFLAEREVLVEVPGETRLLEFPFEIAGDPSRFDAVINRMMELSEQDAPKDGLIAWLRRSQQLPQEVEEKLAETYELLRELRRAKRDHIWGYVTRNLARPVWLSQAGQKSDVLVGNPPWLSYRYMERETRQRFRDECQARGIWAGGKVATHQDLSGYFYVRSVELYLKDSGTIAFVMPYAAMTRRQFDGFRSGFYGVRRANVRTRRGEPEHVFARVQFTDAWAFGSKVQPLFPVPSCVLFARSGQEKEGESIRPAMIRAATGVLPRRDASAVEADAMLVWREQPWPPIAEDVDSYYADRFRQGATIVPRMLTVVEMASTSPLGSNPEAPVVQSRRSSQEKPPWKTLPPLRGNVENPFLRRLYLGESVAPFRLLDAPWAVIPWEEHGQRLLNAQAAQQAGFLHLARWLTLAERTWTDYGRGTMSLVDRQDYNKELTIQFPVAPIRVVYGASGTLPAAAVLQMPNAIVEHGLYWTAVPTLDEGQYLCAVLNAETSRAKVEELQAQGQWGARHFDKLLASLPLPAFNESEPLHQALTAAGAEAETVAAGVTLKEGMHFVTARRHIRDALKGAGVAQRIEEMVSTLLAGK